MWSFDEVRAKAIEALDKDSTLGVLERLKFAHEFLIKDWVRPAYRLFLTRDEALTEEEVPWLGSDFVAKVTKAREERIKLFFMRIISGEILTPNSCPKCGRQGSMRVLLSTATPTFSCVVGLCSGLGTGFTLEQVLRDSKNWRQKASSSIIEGDLDRLIDRFLPSF